MTVNLMGHIFQIFSSLFISCYLIFTNGTKSDSYLHIAWANSYMYEECSLLVLLTITLYISILLWKIDVQENVCACRLQSILLGLTLFNVNRPAPAAVRLNIRSYSFWTTSFFRQWFPSSNGIKGLWPKKDYCQ